MGKSAPAAPRVPDPAATAAAQASANKETAIAQAQLNNVNQNTPFGSLTFTRNDAISGGEGSDGLTGGGGGDALDGVPSFTATTTLAPEQQRLLDLQNQAAETFGQTANEQLGAVRGTLSSPLDFSQFGAAPVANEETRQATRNAIIARSEDDFARQRDALETRLVNQGFDRGTEAFSNAFSDFNSAQNDFRLAADAAAGDEMARTFALERAARDGNINELIQQRSVPLNELNAMLTGSQVTGPQFVGTPQTGIAPTDVIGAEFGAFNAASNNRAQEIAQNNARTQGLFGLLGAGLQGAGAAGGFGPLLGFSDERLKRDVSRIGERDGLGVYLFRYLWSPVWHVGHMAQEVIKSRPDAVHDVGGYLAVDYGALA